MRLFHLLLKWLPSRDSNRGHTKGPRLDIKSINGTSFRGLSKVRSYDLALNNNFVYVKEPNKDNISRLPSLPLFVYSSSWTYHRAAWHSGNTPDSYSRDARFESLTRHRISWQRSMLASSISPENDWTVFDYITTASFHILSDSLIMYPTIRRYIA
jgi:hypothetical protein